MSDIQQTQELRRFVLNHDWDDDALLAQKADHWITSNEPWVHSVKWGQWEGFRRQGENAESLADYLNHLLRWLSDLSKVPSRENVFPARRAWAYPPLTHAGMPLRESLLTEVETASRLPKTPRLEELSYLLADAGLDESDRKTLDEQWRLRRARRFVDLLVMRVRVIKELPDVDL